MKKSMRVMMMMLSMVVMATTASADYVNELTGTDGLINYWGFGEASGTTAVDSVGGDNATHDAGVTLGTAGPGSVDGFAGMTSGNLAATYNANGGTRSDSAADLINTGAGTSDITVSFWYQLDAAGADNTRQALVGYQQAAGVRYNFLMARMETGFLKIYLKDSDNAGAGEQIAWQLEDAAYATAAKDSLWHNLVVSWNGSDLTAHLDGANKVTTSNPTVGGIIGGYTWDPTQSLVFGEDINNLAYLDGSIDEVAVFDTVLSDETIGSLYNAAAVPEPATMGLLSISFVVLLIVRRLGL